MLTFLLVVLALPLLGSLALLLALTLAERAEARRKDPPQYWG